MPLNRPVFDNQPSNVSEVLGEVSNMVKDVGSNQEKIVSSLDKISAEHDLLKKQVNYVASNVDKINATHEHLLNQLTSISHKLELVTDDNKGLKTKVINVTGVVKTTLDVIKTEFQSNRKNLADTFKTVKKVASDVDKMNMEHQLLLNQIKSVDSKLDHIKTAFDDKLNEVQASFDRKLDELITSFDSKLNEVKAGNIVLGKEMAAATRNINHTLNIIKEEPRYTLAGSPIRLIEEYNKSSNWDSLRDSLLALLYRNSVAYKQLQEIELSCEDPLFRVGKENHVELAAILLTNETLLETAGQYGDTMLHGAAYGGSVPMVKLLLRKKAKVDAKNYFGATPLMCAAQNGHLEVIKCLVRTGANILAKDRCGDTAADLARKSGHTDIAQYLLSVTVTFANMGTDE